MSTAPTDGQVKKAVRNKPNVGTALLQYGHLLQESYNILSNRPAEEVLARLAIRRHGIQMLMARAEGAKLLFSRTLDGSFDELELAVTSYVCWRCVASDQGMPGVALTAQVAGGDDMGRLVEARRTVYRLVKRGVLRYINNTSGLSYNGPLYPCSGILGFILGKGGTPAIFNQATIEAKEGAARVPECAPEGVQPPAGPAILPGPLQLYNEIRRHVIGLDPLVRTFVARLRLHCRKMEEMKKGVPVEVPNEVLLFCGPSGSGKTWLAETGGRCCGLPFGSADLSGVTEDGWCGQSLSDVVRCVIQAAGGDAEAARYGIIFADEADSKKGSPGVERDVSGANVQKALLKLVEGTDYQVGGRKGSWDTPLQFNSRGTMFVFGGCFPGLEEIIARQTRRNTPMGFSAPPGGSGGIQRDIHSALEQFGLLPELVNRLTGILLFPAPTVDQLVMIAQAPTGVVSAYSRLLHPGGVELSVSPPAVRMMAEWAHSSRTYARGLKTVMSRLVEDTVFTEVKGRIVFGVGEVRGAIGAVGNEEACGGEAPCSGSG